MSLYIIYRRWVRLGTINAVDSFDATYRWSKRSGIPVSELSAIEFHEEYGLA